MSLRTIFNNEFDNLVQTYAEDLAEDVTYTHVGYSGDYDFTTGGLNKSISTETVRGIFSSFSKEQMTMEDIAPEDVKFTCSVKSTPFTPETNDTILKDGVDYQVIRVRNVAFDSLWVLQLRETQ